jgi:hypothetical protein
MKKRALILLVLALVAAAPLWAQNDKPSKKERKELMKVSIPICVDMIETGDIDPLLSKALNAEGYCTCMMENLLDKYSYKELMAMFTKKSKTDMVLAFYEDPANQTQTMKCMRNNMKDETAMKQLILNDSFGMDACVAGVEKEELPIKLNAEGYCKCMFDKMGEAFTVTELLDEKTYDSEKLQVLAMECVLANVVDSEPEETK